MGSMVSFGHGDGEADFHMYITGDTLLVDELAEIGQRHPDIDLCMLHLGGTRIAGILLTMDGKQGVRLLELLRPKDGDPDALRRLHRLQVAARRLPRSQPHKRNCRPASSRSSAVPRIVSTWAREIRAATMRSPERSTRSSNTTVAGGRCALTSMGNGG